MGAGLPNITSHVQGVRSTGGSGPYSQGALNWDAWSDNWCGAADQASKGYFNMNFNASFSSSIYGSSTTVTPLSLSCKFLISY